MRGLFPCSRKGLPRYVSVPCLCLAFILQHMCVLPAARPFPHLPLQSLADATLPLCPSLVVHRQQSVSVNVKGDYDQVQPFVYVHTMSAACTPNFNPTANTPCNTNMTAMLPARVSIGHVVVTGTISRVPTTAR